MVIIDDYLPFDHEGNLLLCENTKNPEDLVGAFLEKSLQQFFTKGSCMLAKGRSLGTAPLSMLIGGFTTVWPTCKMTREEAFPLLRHASDSGAIVYCCTPIARDTRVRTIGVQKSLSSTIGSRDFVIHLAFSQVRDDVRAN